VEKAIGEYRRKREENLREIEKLKRAYWKSFLKKRKEVLKRLEKLEKKKLPKGMDEKLAKKVEADRAKYVSSLRRALEGIETMDDLGKRLPELAKLHVDHGRYLLIAFEKDLYGINRLLKELSEEYAEYSTRVSELQLPELNVEGTLAQIEETRRSLNEGRAELGKLKRELEAKRNELAERRRELGMGEIDERIKELVSSKKGIEIEVRSKVSKVQKPIRRMRLGGFADDVARDSGLAIEEPNEFLSLLIKVYPRLEGKAKKSAEWLLKNLEGKVGEIRELEREIERLESLRREKLRELESIEEEARTVERLILEVEENVRRLERKLEHLEKELEKEIEALEEVLGERVEG